MHLLALVATRHFALVVMCHFIDYDVIIKNQIIEYHFFQPTSIRW